MNSVLDQLEQEHGLQTEHGIEQPNLDTEPANLDTEQPVDNNVEEVQESTPEKTKGYITYDDWVEQGKDPSDFKGENAYKAEYERINEIRELKDTMKQVVSGVDEWKNQQAQQMQSQIDQAKKDAEIELDRAKEEHDINAALNAQERLNDLNKQQVQQAPQQNPVISEFSTKNPIINQGSAQYDPEFYADMQMMQHTILNQMTGNDPNMVSRLTPNQIERTLSVAYEQAKKLHPNKFVSPRNVRKTAPKSPQRTTKQETGDYGTRLKGSVVNTKNSRDNNPAGDLYEILKKRDPKAAENFAKNVLGEG